MNTAEFVAMQLAKRFTARKIPDRKHVQHCRALSCFTLTRGFKPTPAAASFRKDWFYEGYQRFRNRPEHYYANDVVPWETILEHG